MKLYHLLSGLKFLKSYPIKFLFIAFLGIHIPLIGLIYLILSQRESAISSTTLFIWALVLTLVACALTLYIQLQLSTPIKRSFQALNNYIDKKELPALPEYYTDEMGRLMSGINLTIHALDHHLEAKNDMVSMLSHDLRSPANTIIGMTQLLDATPRTENQAELIKSIKATAEKQLELMAGMLAIIKSDAIGVSSELELVNLAEWLNHTTSMAKETAKQKNISIEQKIDDTIMVKIVPVSFEIVINNLLNNAIKFSHEGGKIEIIAVEKDGGLELAIKDNGIGFSPDKSEELFKQFTKYGRVGTKNESSNGIGLYLCRKIMQTHQGTLTAISAGENQGAAFTVKLSLN